MLLSTSNLVQGAHVLEGQEVHGAGVGSFSSERFTRAWHSRFRGSRPSGLVLCVKEVLLVRVPQLPARAALLKVFSLRSSESEAQVNKRKVEQEDLGGGQQRSGSPRASSREGLG